MEIEKKEKSINFWNRNAEKWKEMASNLKGDYANFPTSEQRGKIVVDGMLQQSKDKNVSYVDIGCGDGELVLSLIDNGFCNVKGFDNSKGMIDEARRKLSQRSTPLKIEDVFVLKDADQKLTGKYDFISAIGLIEYLIDVDSFFSDICGALNDKGFAFIESRNKLFNLFSANNYTQNSEISNLLEELEESKRYSPVSNRKEILRLMGEAFSGFNIEGLSFPEESGTKREKYPFDLPQYSPSQLNDMLSKNGLKIDHVVYYHAHPFPPIFEKVLGPAFNKLAVAMQPLAYTPIATTMFSSFVAIVKKV